MKSKSFLQISVFLITALILPLNQADRVIKVENIFQQNVTIKSGDVMQCEITKTNIEIPPKNDLYLFTTASSHPFLPSMYQFYKVNNKCFTFKVRTKSYAHIAFSSTPTIDRQHRLEVVLEHDNKISAIRQIIKKKIVFLNKLLKGGIINDKEYNGFWIRMLDDHLLEVGRESETIPFLKYRFPKEMPFNYIGFMSWRTPAAWIINGDQKCHTNGTAEQKIIKAESNCFILE